MVMPKISYFLLIILLSSATINTWGKQSEVKRSLISLNKYWSGKKFNFPHKVEKTELNQDAYLITLHLKMLIEQLKESDLSQFSNTQIAKRNNLLNKLSAYAERGIFPKNTKHSIRTPYFIDDFGTPCAVGFLIQESGNTALANEIAATFNYSYIEEMPQEPIRKWAFKHGFRVKELQWIQPGYAPYCPPGTYKNPVCHNGMGCINPDYAADSLIPPYQTVVEYNDGSGWVVDSSQALFFMGARVGHHRITVTDSINQTRIYNYTIQNPPPIILQLTNLPQTDTSCNGGLSVQVQNGKAPYKFDLFSQALNYFSSINDSIANYTGLCAGSYTLVVSDSNRCQVSTTLQINKLTHLAEIQEKKIKLFPLPFENKLVAQNLPQGVFVYNIFNLKGELIKEGQLKSNQNIRLESLSAGTYIFRIKVGEQFHSQKITKLK